MRHVREDGRENRKGREALNSHNLAKGTTEKVIRRSKLTKCITHCEAEGGSTNSVAAGMSQGSFSVGIGLGFRDNFRDYVMALPGLVA